MIHASCLFELGLRSQQATGHADYSLWIRPIGKLVIPTRPGSVKESKNACFQGETGGVPHPTLAPSELNGPS